MLRTTRGRSCRADYGLKVFSDADLKAIKILDKGGKPYLTCAVSDKARPAKPEEVVRQLYLNKLMSEYGYPKRVQLPPPAPLAKTPRARAFPHLARTVPRGPRLESEAPASLDARRRRVEAVVARPLSGRTKKKRRRPCLTLSALGCSRSLFSPRWPAAGADRVHPPSPLLPAPTSLARIGRRGATRAVSGTAGSP
jgi:hypothetical protein